MLCHRISVSPDTILSWNTYYDKISLSNSTLLIDIDQDENSPLTIDLITGDVFMTYLATFKDFINGKRVEMLLPGDRYVIFDIPRDKTVHYSRKGVSINGNLPGDLYIFVKLALPRTCPGLVVDSFFSVIPEKSFIMSH